VLNTSSHANVRIHSAYTKLTVFIWAQEKERFCLVGPSVFQTPESTTSKHFNIENVIFTWRWIYLGYFSKYAATPSQLVTGVRQRGVFSPVLLIVYVNDIICKLEVSGYGCRIRVKYVGILIYADDLLLICASNCDLRKNDWNMWRWNGLVGYVF